MEAITSLLGAVMLVLVGVVLVLALVIVVLHEARYIVHLGNRLRRRDPGGPGSPLTGRDTAGLGASQRPL
jgi:hypothetical protein